MESQLSLFGETGDGGRPTKRGHAGQPGTGPAGETCGTCAHRRVRITAGRYQKCWLMKHHWTKGAGSDIKAKDPACGYWRPIDKQEVS